MKKALLSFAMLCFSIHCFAQKQWTLNECIIYALENNLDLKRLELAKTSSEISLKTSKASFLPDLGGNIGQSFSFGRSTSSTGVIVNQNAHSTSFGISSSMPLFEGFRIYNQIQSDKLNLQASLEDLNQAKDNTSLSICSQYLQVLFNKELYKIALDEVELSKKQVKQTEILVEAGSKSNADLYESKAVLSRDKLNVVQRLNEVNLSLLTLAQLLDIKENFENFNIVEPNTDYFLEIETLPYALDKETLNHLSERRADMKAADYRIKASEKDLNVAKSAYYPSLSFQAGYGTGYYSTMLDQMLNPKSGVMPFTRQLDINQQLSLSFGLRIPIFSRMADFYRVQNAKLTIQAKQLELENSKKAFYNEIQQAYYNASASKEKFISSKEAKTAAEEAFRYTNEKYTNGRSSVYEFDEAKSKLIKTNSEHIQAKYEYIFRSKILDFYNGKSLDF